jgi:hypothetical protein
MEHFATSRLRPRIAAVIGRFAVCSAWGDSGSVSVTTI